MTGFILTVNPGLTLFQLTSSRRGWQLWSIHWNSERGISTHILTKRMTVRKQIQVHLKAFQLTSSRRGWRYSLWIWWMDRYFNSHPHEEDDSGWNWIIRNCSYFNSHPHEEDDWHMEEQAMLKLYFTSHPPEEDDVASILFVFTNPNISTHILTKRMTFVCQCCLSMQSISTHILTKRMTVYQSNEINAYAFQLTSSRRGWQIPIKTLHIWHISTHILTKRMTSYRM